MSGYCERQDSEENLDTFNLNLTCMYVYWLGRLFKIIDKREKKNTIIT